MSLLSPGEDVLIDIDDKEPLIPVQVGQVRWQLPPAPALGELALTSPPCTPHLAYPPILHDHKVIIPIPLCPGGWVLPDAKTRVGTFSLIGEGVCSPSDKT